MNSINKIGYVLASAAVTATAFASSDPIGDSNPPKSGNTVYYVIGAVVVVVIVILLLKGKKKD